MKYSRSMRILHWAMALSIIGVICAGITMVALPDRDPVKFGVFFPWHKSFGMLALFLVVARLLIRFRTVIPPLPPGITKMEARAAAAAHIALYVLMFLVPLSGYVMSSTFTQSDGVYFFGVYLPELLPKNDAWFDTLLELHHVLAFTLLGLVVLHVGAALKHHFLDRRREVDVLSRMT